MSTSNEKTVLGFWDGVWARSPRLRLPSPWLVSSADRMRLLQAEVKPGMRYLEIGCAPGKLLAYVGQVLGAEVSGLDYSPHGIEWNQKLFQRLGIHGDLRCENIFETSFSPGTFDVVHSGGVIEHFDDPNEIVRIHVNLLKPGGVALITIPNLSGAYLRLASYFDLEAVKMHNLELMSCEALARLAPQDLTGQVSAFPAGRMAFGPVHFHKKMPKPLAAGLFHLTNGIGLLQPITIASLCPMLVLRIVRKPL